jgi:DnaK suppressor protein
MATKTTKKPAPKTTKAPANTQKTAPAKVSAAAPAKSAPKPSAKAASKPVTKKPPAPSPEPAKKETTAKFLSAAKPVTKPAVPQPVKTVAVKQQKWDEIRSLLIQLKEATLQEIARSIKSGSEANVGEQTTGDIYDQASSERDRELVLILSDRERQKLHNIDDALLRMQEGEYGICEECDEEIPLGRLKAMPFTRHCVKCKSDLERLQAQTRRIEEDRAYREIPLGDEEEG